jgi:hypothetical protein
MASMKETKALDVLTIRLAEMYDLLQKVDNKEITAEQYMIKKKEFQELLLIASGHYCISNVEGNN